MSNGTKFPLKKLRCAGPCIYSVASLLHNFQHLCPSLCTYTVKTLFKPRRNSEFRVYSSLENRQTGRVEYEIKCNKTPLAT